LTLALKSSGRVGKRIEEHENFAFTAEMDAMHTNSIHVYL